MLNWLHKLYLVIKKKNRYKYKELQKHEQKAMRITRFVGEKRVFESFVA